MPRGKIDPIEIIQKKYGEAAFARISDGVIENVETFSTGSLMLDYALGVGGYPVGRTISLVGNESSGKTTLALHAISEAQKEGKLCAFIDAEHTFDIEYAKSLGVNPESIYINQPDSAEQALNILDAIVRSDAIGLVVVDSVAALAPQRELDGEAGDSHIGILARLMSQAMRRMSGYMRTNKVTVIFINQYRMNINAIGYGPKKTTPGGRALRYHSSVIVDVARTGTDKDGGIASSNRTKATVQKNKVGPPYRVAEFDIEFGKGISRSGEIIDVCLKFGDIVRSGSWYKDESGESLTQGRSSLKIMLEDNKEMYDKYYRKARERLFDKPVEAD